MLLKDIKLENFRGHAKEEFSFSSETTFILGANASGKTSIIEAIYYLASGKSFRASQDRETVSFTGEIAKIKGFFVISKGRDILKDNLTELEAIITKGEVLSIKTPIKRFFADGIPKSMVNFAGRIKAVLFWPEDLDIVTDSPSLRRKYLDMVLSQTDYEYRRALSSYERGLRQRNRILKAIREGRAARSELAFWDHLLIKSGNYISFKREEFLDFVNSFAQIKGQKEELVYSAKYDKSAITKERLERYKKEEVMAGVTLVGPHRDDIGFTFNKSDNGENGNEEENKSVTFFASRGEQRLCILRLKLCEVAYIERRTGEKPILLLDDILSEFDHDHRQLVFDLASERQTIITATDEHFLTDLKRQSLKIIRL